MTEVDRADRPLSGHAVLLTRPAHQLAKLTALLETAGAKVIPYPTIEIASSPATPFLEHLAFNLQHYDIALFVSRNAVHHAFRWMNNQDLPDALKLGVIGQGSAQTLAELGYSATINPVGEFNSEGLLATPELQEVDGKNIMIFRGQAGRNLLGDTLRDRGATVSYCEVYRRQLPDYPPYHFTQCCSGKFPTVAVFTSTEGMRNCMQLLDAESAAKLQQIPWLLISERMRESARKLGHNEAVLIAAEASDAGLLGTLEHWAQDAALAISSNSKQSF